MRIVVDGEPVEARAGDSLAVAMLRAGVHPGRGGALCLAGDCPHCACSVDGVPYTRTCERPATEGAVVVRHPADGAPAVPPPGPGADVPLEHVHADAVVIGLGPAGRAEADALAAAGRRVVALDARRGEEVVGVYPGPLVIARTPAGMRHVAAAEIVVATGAAEEQPACPGNDLEGIVTARAAEALAAAGVDLGRVARVELPERPVRFEGAGRVEAVVVRRADGAEERRACDTAVLALGLHPRDVLARTAPGPHVRVVGDAALPSVLPPPPEAGVFCPCTGARAEDLPSVWERGFRDVELVKRATLACTGTCQGSACLPHVRGFIAAQGVELPPPITARPLARQVTVEEAAAGFHLPAIRRTALHDEHVALGGQMERFGGWWRPWTYGDTEAEYRAVREGVSIGDVGTLGKMVVSGPDAVELLERLYPCHVADLAPGRMRYALLLDERGYCLDDGLVARDGERRFTLTFTTGGASFAELWVRDWAEGFGLDVRILDRTAALGAINVTGPEAAALLARLGLAEAPAYMRHVRADVAAVPCHVFRLGFTGEASFELHHPADRSVELWRALSAAGADLGCRPHGLDALLTLRLEKGHIVHGMDTDFDSTPRRLDMAWAARMEKADFIGRHALARVDREPLDRQLVGLVLDADAEAPVEGSVLRHDGAFVGHVTSSRRSHVLGHPVMLAWLRVVDGALPETVEVDGRTARRVPLPFYDPEGRRARA